MVLVIFDLDAGEVDLWLKGAGFEVWSLAFAAFIGSQVGRLAYHASKPVYAKHGALLLAWAPLALAVSGAMFGLVWSFFLMGGPIASIYGAYYGLIWALPRPGQTGVGVLVFQAAALATHMLVRRTHLRDLPNDTSVEEEAVDSRGALASRVSVFIPGVVFSLSIAIDLALAERVAMVFWCALVSFVIHAASRHTFRHSVWIQFYWAPLMLLGFSSLCLLPLLESEAFDAGMSFLVNGYAAIGALAVLLMWRWLDRRDRPCAD